jgi:hypothetical protein
LLLSSPASPLTIAAAPAKAQSIIDEWATVKPPAAPALKPVTVDPKTTALLMLDFMNQNCGERARCIASIPAMKKLLGEARSARVLSAQHERFANHPGKRRLIGAPTLDGMREGARAARRMIYYPDDRHLRQCADSGPTLISIEIWPDAASAENAFRKIDPRRRSALRIRLSGRSRGSPRPRAGRLDLHGLSQKGSPGMVTGANLCTQSALDISRAGES